MTNESTVILLKCKLNSLKHGLQKAIANGSSKEVIKKWETNCIETQELIIEMDNL